MTLEKWLTLLLPLLIAIIGSIPGILAYQNQKKSKTKEKAETLDVITDTNLKLIKPLNDRIDTLEQEKKLLVEENEILLKDNKKIKAKIDALEYLTKEQEKKIKELEEEFNICKSDLQIKLRELQDCLKSRSIECSGD